MKLRIRGNSIRLRLSQTEVAQVAAHGRVDDAIAFVGARLGYSLEVADVPAMEARFEAASIVVRVPRAEASAWAKSDRVGMEREEPIEGGALRILVEKDFACLAPRPGEDDTDAFPNPDAGEESVC